MQITSTGWRTRYAYIPIKLINGKWIWFKPYYFRKYIGIDDNGLMIKSEYADIFYVIANPDNTILTSRWI